MATAAEKKAAEKAAEEEATRLEAERLAEAEAAAAALGDNPPVVQVPATPQAGVGADLEADVATGGATPTEGAREPVARDLSKFIGHTDLAAQVKAEVEVVDAAIENAEDWGGRTAVVVTFDYFAAHVDGRYRRARQGAVLKVMKDVADRGVKVGALRKLSAD